MEATATGSGALGHIARGATRSRRGLAGAGFGSSLRAFAAAGCSLLLRGARAQNYTVPNSTFSANSLPTYSIAWELASTPQPRPRKPRCHCSVFAPLIRGYGIIRQNQSARRKIFLNIHSPGRDRAAQPCAVNQRDRLRIAGDNRVSAYPGHGCGGRLRLRPDDAPVRPPSPLLPLLVRRTAQTTARPAVLTLAPAAPEAFVPPAPTLRCPRPCRRCDANCCCDADCGSSTESLFTPTASGEDPSRTLPVHSPAAGPLKASARSGQQCWGTPRCAAR